MIDPELIDATKGFLDSEEGDALYALALDVCARGPCLEIGSYCGKSTLYLGSACREKGGTLFSVDHHRGSEEQQPGQAYCDPELIDPRSNRVDTFGHFRRTLAAAGLEDTVVPVVCASLVAARCWATPLSLVFIDGGHDHGTVLGDYIAWSRHVVAGGYLLFHDIFDDPADGGQAPWQVFRLAVASGLFERLPQVGSLGVLRRR
jgi:hypothetical protein